MNSKYTTTYEHKTAHLHVIIKCAYHRPGRTVFGVSCHCLLNFSNLEERAIVSSKHKTVEAHREYQFKLTSKNLIDVSALPVAKYFPS